MARRFLRGERVRVVSYGGDDQRPVGCSGVLTDLAGDTCTAWHTVTLDTNADGKPIRGVRVHVFPHEIEPEGTAARPVDVLTYGMTPERLGRGFKAFVERAYRRITGVGAEQYSTAQSQKFEDMPLSAIAEGALEELEDLAVYAGMLHIRFQRITAALRAAEQNGGK